MQEQENTTLIKNIYDAFARGDIKMILDRVTTFGRFSGVAKATGTRFDVPYGHYFRIEGGKIKHYINLSDTATLSAVFGAAKSRSAEG